jgi:hypothetical protein
VDAEGFLEPGAQLDEVAAARLQSVDRGAEVEDRSAALSAEAEPSLRRLGVDVHAGGLVVVQRAADLAVAPGGAAGERLHVLGGRDLQQRIGVAPAVPATRSRR